MLFFGHDCSHTVHNPQGILRIRALIQWDCGGSLEPAFLKSSGMTTLVCGAHFEEQGFRTST